MMDVNRTARGFVVARGVDRYGQPYSIQDSSLATEEAIWLGSDGEESGRAHLTRDMAAELIPLLQRFVDTGTIAEPPAAKPEPVPGGLQQGARTMSEETWPDGAPKRRNAAGDVLHGCEICDGDDECTCPGNVGGRKGLSMAIQYARGSLDGPVVGGYAFWPYDLSPGVVGGKVTALQEDGRFNVRGYGDGRGAGRFRSVDTLFLDAEAGRAMKADVEALHALRNRTEDELRSLLRQETERRLNRYGWRSK